MKRYQLMRKLMPAAQIGGIELPAAETLSVTGQLDCYLAEVWMAICWAANRGRFGPFTAVDLVNLAAEIAGPDAYQVQLDNYKAKGRAPALTAARARPRLRRLVEMGLITEA